jgi:hypothetical protein
MPDRTFAYSVAYTGSYKLSADPQEEQRIIHRLIDDGLTADRERQGWLDRSDSLTRLRLGIRKPKTWPWPGASNLSIPVIDAQLRKYKPMLMKLVVQPDPVCQFDSIEIEDGSEEAERLAEAELTWLFRTHMRAIEPLAFIVDSIGHNGYGVAQIGWDYKSEYECRVADVRGLFGDQTPQDAEQVAAFLAKEFDVPRGDARVEKSLQKAAAEVVAGAEFVKLSYIRVVTDRPAIWDRAPQQVIVPARCTNYGDSEWIIVQHLFSARTLRQRERDGFFVKGFVDKILGGLKSDQKNFRSDFNSESPSINQWNHTQDEADKTWGHEDPDNILIWECYHWSDPDEDGVAERVVTFVHPRTKTHGSTRLYAFPFHRWPFVKFDFEKVTRRFYSPRGISSKLEGIQRAVNATHNARLDAMALRNAPVYQMPVLAGFKARNLTYMPGKIMEVPMGTAITPLSQDRGAFPESMSEENYLRSIAEGYIGTFDQALSSPMGGGDNRTATEVNASVQLAASTASLDTILFQLAMGEVYDMVWALWMELRPPEITIKVSGANQNTNTPTLRKITKAEIDKKFRIVPTGTIANTNRALELANSREALNFFAGDASGLIDPYELRYWYFSLLDPRVARKVVLPRDQAAYNQTLMQAAAEVQADPTLLASMGMGGAGTQEQYGPLTEPTETAAI